MQTPHQWIWQQPSWPTFEWDKSTLMPLLARARLAQGKVLGMVRMLDPNLTLEAVAAILVEDGITTSAIEGEKLDLNSVRSSVAKHLGLPTAGLPTPSRNIDGLIDVLLDATRQYHTPLTLDRLYKWQAALFPTGQSGLTPIITGALRGDAPMQVISGAIGQEKVHFVAPAREVLNNECDQFIKWFNSTVDMDGIIRAGLAHLWFVTLHPFEDGNERLARAITDMALSQDENQPMRFFSLSAQILRERESYYAILESTQRGNVDVTAWLKWFLIQVEAAAILAEKTVGNTLAKAHFWLRHQTTHLNERQRKVLNRLLDAGKDGFEGGINTRKYGNLTKVSRATAYRELADLVEKKCLATTQRGGRSSGYEILWGG